MKEEILRRIKRLAVVLKRSIKKDRERWIKGGILAAVLLVIILFVGNCACGERPEVEEAARGVMTITVAPSPTPTETPRQVGEDAAATNGNVTMINEYLVQKESQSGGTADSETGGENEETGETGEETAEAGGESGETGEETAEAGGESEETAGDAQEPAE